MCKFLFLNSFCKAPRKQLFKEELPVKDPKVAREAFKLVLGLEIDPDDKNLPFYQEDCMSKHCAQSKAHTGKHRFYNSKYHCMGCCERLAKPLVKIDIPHWADPRLPVCTNKTCYHDEDIYDWDDDELEMPRPEACRRRRSKLDVKKRREKFDRKRTTALRVGGGRGHFAFSHAQACAIIAGTR